MGNRLDNVEFHHVGWKNIFVKVDGKRLKDWQFWLLELGNDHSVSTLPLLILLLLVLHL